VVNWKLVYTKQAQKAAKKLLAANLRENPPYKKLVGDLEGAYSRRINIKHRLVYQVFERSKTVKVIRMWTHYE
jgi:toxin YoeB